MSSTAAGRRPEGSVRQPPDPFERNPMTSSDASNPEIGTTVDAGAVATNVHDVAPIHGRPVAGGTVLLLHGSGPGPRRGARGAPRSPPWRAACASWPPTSPAALTRSGPPSGSTPRCA